MKRAFSGFKIKCALDDCNEILDYENIKAHEAECFEKLIACENCKEEIKRLELGEHMVSYSSEYIYFFLIRLTALLSYALF